MFGIKRKFTHSLMVHGMLNDLRQVRISPVGYACNHACPMCWRITISKEDRKEVIKKQDGAMTLDDYIRMIRSYPPSVKEMDIVGGGEPLLFPHIDELFREIRSRGIHGRLITNGSYLTEKVTRELIACDWNSVRVSIHAGSADVFKKVNGATDYERVTDNIRSFVRVRGKNRTPWISLLFVIQRDNYDDLIPFAKLAMSLGVDEVQFDTLIPTNVPHLQLTAGQWKTVVRQVGKLRSLLTIRHNLDQVEIGMATHPMWGASDGGKYLRTRYCPVVQNSVDISSDGTVRPCCFSYGKMAYGNVKVNPIRDIWKRHARFRKELAQGKFRDFCRTECPYLLPEKPVPFQGVIPRKAEV